MAVRTKFAGGDGREQRQRTRAAWFLRWILLISMAPE